MKSIDIVPPFFARIFRASSVIWISISRTVLRRGLIPVDCWASRAYVDLVEVSTAARNTARDAIRGAGDVLETDGRLPDLAVANAPLAASGLDSFALRWADHLGRHVALIDAAATALTIVVDSFIDTDAAIAESLPG